MSDYHSRGGKTSQASLTPEERRRRARKGARRLGKAGRSARVAKAWVTRRRVADEAKAISDQTNAHFQAIFQREIDKAEAKGQIHPTNAAEMREAVRPKRALPKPGTMNARALETMRTHRTEPQEPWDATQLQVALPGVRVAIEKVRNALYSLRTAGYVVSEGPGKEKLWRLA